MKKQKFKFPSTEVGKHHRIVFLLMVAIGLIIYGKAIYISIIDRDYWLTVAEQREKNSYAIPAVRGNILAADGQVLSTSVPEYKLYYDPFYYEKDPKQQAKLYAFRDSIIDHCMDSIVNGMKEIIPTIDTDRLRRTFAMKRNTKNHCIELHPQRVTYIQLQAIKQLPLFRLSAGLSGLDARKSLRRLRPFGGLASRTLGRFHPTDDLPQSGLELAFDSVLSGKPGLGHKARAGNRTVGMVDSLPVDGCDVLTTLDVKLQDYVESTLRQQLVKLNAEVGMCILMEVQTGDVKAISSLSKNTQGDYLERDPRAVTNMREPGSVFKPMSMMVAMDDGKLNMNSTFDTGNGIRYIHGARMRDESWRKGGDGVLSVPEIIKRSSNVGTSMLIYNAYIDNPDKFVEGIHRIGVTEDLKIPIPGYKRPKVRFKRENPQKWYSTTLPWMSIGYETQVPPISVLTFYNGVANGGKLVRPRFVTAIRRGEEIVQEFPTVVLREQMCKPEVLRNVQICLEGVVGKNSGTGKLAYSKQFSVAGKTGTAQVHEKGSRTSRYLVSFAGYFPADRPRYSMIVCIERMGEAFGGVHCAPVFKKVAEVVMARDLKTDFTAAIDSSELRTAVPPMLAGNLDALHCVLDNFKMPYHKNAKSVSESPWGYNAAGASGIIITPETKQEGVPSVVGYGLRDAVYRLERLGVKVHCSGVGRVVKQSVAAGTPIKKGLLVKLELSTQNTTEKKHHKTTETPKTDSIRKETPSNPETTTPQNHQQTASTAATASEKNNEKRVAISKTAKAKA